MENTMVHQGGFGVGTSKWFLVEKNVPRSKTFVSKLKINVPVVLIEHFFSIKEQWCRYTKITLVYQSVTLTIEVFFFFF